MARRHLYSCVSIVYIVWNGAWNAMADGVEWTPAGAHGLTDCELLSTAALGIPR